jgi:hypothetical protein
MCAFYELDESEFYGRCVEEFLLTRADAPVPGDRIVELGVGSGKALCRVLHRTGYAGVIDGYELDPNSCRMAAETIERYGVAGLYRVTNTDFFTATASLARPLSAIANPPYLPSDQASASFPVLSGGPRGNAVTKRIIRSGFATVMVMLSSFSDPLETIALATACGYSVRRWIAQPLRMGPYSSRAAVRRRIDELAASGRAFVRSDSYLLVGVTWCRGAGPAPDGSADLVEALRVFAGSRGQPADRSGGHVQHPATPATRQHGSGRVARATCGAVDGSSNW